MRKTTAAGIIVILVALAFSTYYLTKDLNRSDRITIGAILPLTGDAASYGIAIKQGIESALRKINSKGGIKGTPLSVIYEDDKADPKEGVSAINKLISINKVHAIIGAVPSSVTLAIAPIAEKNRVVLLSPASSSPRLTSAGDYIFRNYPSDTLEGKLVAQYVVNNKYSSSAVITINNDYGNGLDEVFSKEYVSLKGHIVMDEKYNEGETDFRTILAKVKEANPKCIFIVGYSKELGRLVRQARELGIKTQFFSTVNFYDKQSIVSGGTAVEGVVFSSPVFDVNSHQPAVADFVAEYKKAYNENPDVWAAHGYDALLLVVEAMNTRGVSSDNIRDGLYSIKDFPGVSGVTTFDKNGDVIKQARFLTVKNGEFVPVEGNR